MSNTVSHLEGPSVGWVYSVISRGIQISVKGMDTGRKERRLFIKYLAEESL